MCHLSIGKFIGWKKPLRSLWEKMISLHIRSMWETICDARPSRKWQGKICAQIGKNTLFWDLLQILALWVLTTTEHPPQMNFRQILALCWSIWRLIAVSPKDTISLFKYVCKNRMWCEKTTSNFYRKSVYIFEEKNQNTAELSFINIQTIISEDSNVMVVYNYHLLIMLVLHWSKKLSEIFIWIWANLGYIIHND